MQPWLREIEVTIGSVCDWKQDPTFSGPPAPVALRIYSDGTQNHLRVRFSVHKHWVGSSTPTTIQIYNLSSQLRESLLSVSGTKEMRGAQVILKVGWANGESVGLGTKLQPIFMGGLWAAYSRREGPDIITTLSCLAELPAYRGTVQKTVAANTSLKDLIHSLAQTIPGITVDPALIIIDAVHSVGRRGMTLSGSVIDCLDILSRTYGFSWHIMDGVFEAGMDVNGDQNQAFMGATVNITNENGFLIRAEPMLVSPWQQQAGITIQTLLCPLINPGRVVNLESNMNPRLNGSYFAQTVSHSGDTFSNIFTTNIETLLITPVIQATGVQSVDQAGLNFIAKEEGGNINHIFPVDGIPHIGVSHRLTALEYKTKRIMINGVNVDVSGTITAQQGLDLEKQDLAKVEKALNTNIKKPLNQSQYNALASIGYNGGPGVATGNLAKAVNEGDYAKVGQLIPSYKITSEGTGQVSKNLIARRKREAALWNGNG